MKKGLFLLVFVMLMPLVLAQQDIFSISFHGTGTNQSLTLDLGKYISKPGPYKHSEVQNVIIIIDGSTAVITPKDTSWFGIEDITFAPAGVEIPPPESPEEKAARLARRNITVSKEELDTSLGPVVEASFYTVAGNLTATPINISGFLTEDAVSVELNDEVSLNISLAEDSSSLHPDFIIDVHDRKQGLSLADYDQPSNWLFYGLLMLFIVAFVVVSAYFYTGYAQTIFGAVMSKEEVASRKVDVSALKRAYRAKMSSLKGKVSGSPKVALKEAMGLLNGFFSDYLRMASPSRDRVVSRLSKRGVSRSVVNSVAGLYDDYASMVYGKEEVSVSKVKAFVSKDSGLMGKL